MTEETKVIVKSDTFDKDIDTLVTNILDEQDPSKTKDLVELFNWNMSKKNVARIRKLNNLYDSITDQMTERVSKRADQFSNSDLLDYVKTIQGAIDVNTKNLSQVQEPPLIVQQHNTQINVNMVDNFDREAKARILAAVQATLKQATSIPSVEYTITDVNDKSSINEEEENKNYGQ